LHCGRNLSGLAFDALIGIPAFGRAKFARAGFELS
jgi:hypothetical protein